MNVDSYPDVEALLVGWAPGITGAAAGVEIPDDVATFVRVLRVGGPAGMPYDRPIVDLDCYAPDRAAANALAHALAGAVIYQLPGYLTAVVVVSASEVIAGPAARPDPNPNLRCVGLTVRLAVKPR